jgi:hypothetical protein
MGEAGTATHRIDGVRFSVARWLKKDDDLVALLDGRGVTVAYPQRFDRGGVPRKRPERREQRGIA